MKKLFAVILTISILFLCACAGREEKPVTTSESGETSATVLPLLTTTVPVTTIPVIITEWGTDLLPEVFPKPPEGTYGFIIEEGDPKTDEGNFKTKWVRIKFSCPAKNFFSFTNEMIDLGYLGASKEVTNGTYYPDGIKGYWQNGKHMVRINSSYLDKEGTLTVIMDIVPCTDNFPEQLLQYFPKFDGYTAGEGHYCGHDSGENFLTTDVSSGFSPYWHWSFQHSNCFMGVTYEEFEEYYTTLGDMGFAGIITSSMLDGCNVICVDVTKEINGYTYGVYTIFNQSLRTLDVVYTNNPHFVNAD